MYSSRSRAGQNVSVTADVLWCRRKKRCIRFVDSADECQNSTNLIVAPAAADSTSDVPGDVMMTSPRPGFPAADTVSKTAAGNSPLHRQTTLCDSSAQKNNNTSQPHWTSPQRGIPAWRHCLARWRHLPLVQLFRCVCVCVCVPSNRHYDVMSCQTRIHSMSDKSTSLPVFTENGCKNGE